MQIGHFYRPIKAFNGYILKYQGIATSENILWFTAEALKDDSVYLPGLTILAEYKGDRIRSNNHEEYHEA